MKKNTVNARYARTNQLRNAKSVLAGLCVAIILTTAGCGMFGRAPEPEWKKIINAKLEEPVSFRFLQTSVVDVAAFFSIRQVNIVVDTRIVGVHNIDSQYNITSAGDSVPLKAVLRDCLSQVGLTYTVRDYVIFISTKERITALDARPKVAHDPATWKVMQEKLARPVSFDFVMCPPSDVAAFFRSQLKVNIIDDSHALANHDLTLKLKDVPVKAALDWICFLTYLRYVVSDEVLFISTPEHVEAVSKTKIAYYDFAGTNPDSRKSIEAVLDTPISVSFIASPIEDVAGFYRSLMHVPITVDAPAIKKLGSTDISLELHNIKYRNVLTWICRLSGLVYLVKDGTILVTTPEGVKERLGKPPQGAPKGD